VFFLRLQKKEKKKSARNLESELQKKKKGKNVTEMTTDECVCFEPYVRSAVLVVCRKRAATSIGYHFFHPPTIWTRGGWCFFLIVCVLSWLSHEAALPGPDAMPLGGDAYLFVSICDSITLTKCFSVYETGMGTPGGVEDVPGST